jgi:putative intracellular protease/amidase
MPHTHNPPTVLMLVTSHARLGSTGKPTGIWAEELTTAYYVFADAGWRVRLASPLGGEPPFAPESRVADVASVQRFFADAAAGAALRACQPIGQVSEGSFHAVFVPGGHGTMWDLATSPEVASLIGHAFDAGMPIGSVCHGPAALVAARTIDGEPIVRGQRIACFSNDEEAEVGLTKVVPFLLQSRLQSLGAELSTAPNFMPHAVRSGTLVTGQNPQSTEPAARLLLTLMNERQAVST